MWIPQAELPKRSKVRTRRLPGTREKEGIRDKYSLNSLRAGVIAILNLIHKKLALSLLKFAAGVQFEFGRQQPAANLPYDISGYY